MSDVDRIAVDVGVVSVAASFGLESTDEDIGRAV